MLKICGIYKISSRIHPERFYIGSSINIIKRWERHKSELKHQIHHSPKLQRHYNKYGWDDLVFEIIEQFEFIDARHLESREDIYLHPKPYFNCTERANSCAGYKHRPESRKKMSIAQRQIWDNKVMTEEEHQNRSNAQKGHKRRLGKHNTPEQNKKIGDANRGWISPKTIAAALEARKNLPHPMQDKHHTIESRMKMSESKKGTQAGENNPFFGKHHSEESKSKIGKANSGRKQSAEMIRKRMESTKRTKELKKLQKNNS